MPGSSNDMIEMTFHDTEPRPTSGPRDLLSLMSASILELLAELHASGEQESDEIVPSRAKQIGDLVVAEAIRLIRLGTRVEVADAAVAVSRAVLGTAASQHAEVKRLLFVASTALTTASAASSNGGELSVLRSWNGKALEAVRLISMVPGQALARATLRAKLGVAESYLSHLLSDLEAAGLADRIHAGRSVTVHLGPTARMEHVQRLLHSTPPEPDHVRQRAESEQQGQLVREAIQSAIDGREPEGNLSIEALKTLRTLGRRIAELRQINDALHIALGEVLTGVGTASVRMHVSGTIRLVEAPIEAVNEDIVWIASMEDGQISRISPWSSALGWLDTDTPQADRFHATYSPINLGGHLSRVRVVGRAEHAAALIVDSLADEVELIGWRRFDNHARTVEKSFLRHYTTRVNNLDKDANRDAEDIPTPLTQQLAVEVLPDAPSLR
jgi:DNA-binding transcriptional ArsR family regulator